MRILNKHSIVIAGLIAIGVSGSVYAATKSYPLRGFDQLQLAGHYQVEFTQAKQYAVSVTSNNLDDVQVSVSGKQLIADQKSHFSVNQSSFQINISSPKLASVSLSGNYKGDFVLSTEKSFNLNTQGHGSVSLSGKLKKFVLDSKGSLVIHAKKACTGAFAVRSTGTLSATFCADKNASFDRMNVGEADIKIYGQPVFGKALSLGPVSVQVIR